MTSQISWLDSTPEEQRAARELIAMFGDKESRDELGIGPIRDAFSDLLFPGTSVLQTRARYYLFIPWCYRTPDVTRLSGKPHRDRGRAKERALIKTLQNAGGDDMTGLIGARAGVNVRNLPSDVYWNGLVRYRVREHRGGIGSLEAVVPTEGATEVADRAVTEWNRTLPPVPKGFPESVDGGFKLTSAEASWLKERIVTTSEGTLLAHLLEADELLGDGAKTPWFAAPDFDEPVLHHARMFSTAMQGAALLYNLIIAERYAAAGLEGDDEDSVTTYRDWLAEWHEDLRANEAKLLSVWDVDEMWTIVRKANPNVRDATRDFVTTWVAGLRASKGPAGDGDLRNLVEEREKRKGAQSRLKNEKMLAAWSGASGTGQLTYRWGTVKTMVNDIIRGLDNARS